jgi:hypothetical protein
MPSQRFWVEVWVIPEGYWWYETPEDLKFKAEDIAAAKMAAQMVPGEIIRIAESDLRQVARIKARVQEYENN